MSEPGGLGCHFFRDKLSVSEQMLYDRIGAAVLSGNSDPRPFSWKRQANLGEKQVRECIKNSVQALVDDHPELYWLEKKYEITIERSRFSILLSSRYTTKEVERIDRLLNHRLVVLTSDLPPDRYLQTLLIYTRIVRSLSWQKDGEEDREAHTVVGPLLYRRGVCSGYTSLFLLTLRQLGIPCHRIQGGGHEWAGAYLNDGQLYHFDLTWEAVFGGKIVSYSYFCRSTDEFLNLGHTIETKLPASGSRRSYYESSDRCYSADKIPIAKLGKELIERQSVQFMISGGTKQLVEKILQAVLRKAPPGDYQYLAREDTGIVYRKEK